MKKKILNLLITLFLVVIYFKDGKIDKYDADGIRPDGKTIIVYKTIETGIEGLLTEKIVAIINKDKINKVVVK